MKLFSQRASVVALPWLCAGLMLGTGVAQAQQYPTKVVRVIVPFAPGGGSDITARVVLRQAVRDLGQQFIVDNRGGAAGMIGMELTAKAPPDGYTIMMMSGSFSATSAVQRPAFDPINTIVAVAEFGIHAVRADDTSFAAGRRRPRSSSRSRAPSPAA